MTQEIIIGQQHFILHPFGAIFWEEKQMVLIADVHLGKVSHFRNHGIAIPFPAVAVNFKKMDTVLHYFKPEILCFLGDLFHSTINKEWVLFENWASKIKPEILLIAGNHDIIHPENYKNIGIAIDKELQIDNFYLTHHPEERPGLFNFCGHIHPGIQLNGLGKQRIKVSCFFRKPNQLILPAFGTFTGNYILMPTEEDTVYALTKEKVIEISLKPKD